MTDTNKQPTSKTPSHIVYHVRNREGGDPTSPLEAKRRESTRRVN